MRRMDWRSPAAMLLALSLGGTVGAEPADATLGTKATTAAPAPVVRLRHGVFKYSSYPAAWTSAQQSNRPILVFATSANCPHCTRMVGESFQSPQVSRFVNDSFETVYVNRTEQPELAAKLKIRWFPTTIVVGPDNQVLDVIEGYIDAKTLSQRLQTSVAAHQATASR